MVKVGVGIMVKSVVICVFGSIPSYSPWQKCYQTDNDNTLEIWQHFMTDPLIACLWGSTNSDTEKQTLKDLQCSCKRQWELGSGSAYQTDCVSRPQHYHPWLSHTTQHTHTHTHTHTRRHGMIRSLADTAPVYLADECTLVTIRACEQSVSGEKAAPCSNLFL